MAAAKRRAGPGKAVTTKWRRTAEEWRHCGRQRVSRQSARDSNLRRTDADRHQRPTDRPTARHPVANVASKQECSNWFAETAHRRGDLFTGGGRI